MHEEFNKALTKARLDLLRHPKAVFLSTLVLLMKTKIDTSIPTAATDGLAIYYNPDFFMGLERPVRMSLLAHECMHPALQHLGRMHAGTDPMLWNCAGDYVINAFLVNAGFKLGQGWLYDKKYDGWSTQQVYDDLTQKKKNAESFGGSFDEKPSMDDLLKPGESEPDKTPKEAEAQIVSNIQAAAIAVKMREAQGADPGTIPGDIQVFLDSLLKPKLPMATHLRRFFREIDKSDYSWQKPNRRFMPMILPGLKGHKLMDIAMAYDMSMSVSNKDTLRYQSEVYGVLRQLKPNSLTVVQFDHGIRSVHKVRSARELSQMELRGRGGTCIEPVMEWAKEKKPTVLIVFTDGEYHHPSFNPGCPVLWMIHGPSRDKFHCDFGTTIRFDV